MHHLTCDYELFCSIHMHGSEGQTLPQYLLLFSGSRMLWLPDQMAFAFSSFSMGLAFKNRHISRKIQQVVNSTKAEESDWITFRLE